MPRLPESITWGDDGRHELRPDEPPHPEQTRERPDPANYLCIPESESVLGAGDLHRVKRAGLGMVTWNLLVETCTTRLMSSFSMQICCWARLSFTPLFAPEVVGEVGFEADPDHALLCTFLLMVSKGL